MIKIIYTKKDKTYYNVSICIRTIPPKMLSMIINNRNTYNARIVTVRQYDLYLVSENIKLLRSISLFLIKPTCK